MSDKILDDDALFEETLYNFIYCRKKILNTKKEISKPKNSSSTNRQDIISQFVALNRKQSLPNQSQQTTTYLSTSTTNTNELKISKILFPLIPYTKLHQRFVQQSPSTKHE